MMSRAATRMFSWRIWGWEEWLGFCCCKSWLCPHITCVIGVILCHSLGQFFKIYYLFIFREKGREGERERNINVWLPFMCPLLGTWPETRHMPWLEMEPVTLRFREGHSIHWATPPRAPCVNFICSDQTVVELFPF